ncbi:MAG: prepilin-type N-terminal cleavage/methylation domain-containing protein [Candidatus Aegiribacteria sp.]|nr:prepilin-type N-terminal cleavage/methylation domain-containing protein [Candidatus Aegiribacteria sp.]
MNEQRGFTLVELMIVIIIVGILAAIAVPKFMGMKLNAHAARIISDYDMFRTALYRYYAVSGEFPRDRYPGGAVPELIEYLPDGFKYNLRPELDVRYDWEKWVSNGNPWYPWTGTILGLSVTTRDKALVNAIDGLYAGDFHYTLGNNYTFIIEAIPDN